MRNSKANSTIWVLVALVAVCCGSFLAVRALNSSAQPAAPVIVTTALTPGGSVTTQFTTLDIPTIIEEPETEETEETKEATEVTTETTTKPNQFTTFSGVASTTKPAPSTTKAQPVTTTKVAPTQVDEKETDPVKRAAVFSDGFLSYQYNAEEDYYYTVTDPWQRQFGFNELYDLGASFIIFYYDTMRCKFNYDHKDWLIQFWKGQYGFAFIGGEIGVYNKPEDRDSGHYDAASDKDMLYMSMSFYRKGEEMLTREYAKYWWCTGFVPGQLDRFSDRTELAIRCKITMKDQKMLKAFCSSLESNGLERGEDYTTNKLDVYVVW